MAETSATPRTQDGERTICLYFEQDQYSEIVADSKLFRRHLDRFFEVDPEIFPQ